MTPLDGSPKYPNVDQLIPDISNYSHRFEMDIPWWFKDVKPTYRYYAETTENAVPQIGITSTGNFTMDKCDWAFNLFYLAPLCGLSEAAVFCDNKGKNIGPMVVKGDNWTYVVMPIRHTPGQAMTCNKRFEK